MGKLGSIIRFSLPFIRPYKWALMVGILMGILFGMSNAGVLWTMETILTRLDAGAESAPAGPANETESSDAGGGLVDSMSAEWDGAIGNVKEGVAAKVDAWIDPWVPKAGRPIDGRQVVGLLLFLPLFVALRSATDYFSLFLMNFVGQSVVNDVRVKVVENLSRLSLDYFNRSTLGNMVTHINGDTRAVERFLSSGVDHIVKDPITIISVFTWLCLIDWPLTLASVVLLPVCLVPILYLGRKARKASKKMVQTNVVQAGMMIEMLGGIRVVKSFNLEGNLVERFRKLSGQLIRQTMKAVRATELTGPIIETVSVFGVGAIILFVAYTRRDIPELVTFFGGLIMLYMPVKKLAKLHMLVERTSVGIQRLINILAEEPSVKDPPHPQHITSFEQSITFENVSFAYQEKPVLEELNLTIPRGCKLGVAGESGSGKSTLVNLIFRFFDPTHGVIRLDGHDLRDISMIDLRNRLALVSQEVVIFDQTVHDNIACGKLHATREEVVDAAKHAFAHEFIMNLEEGYDTRLGEKGVLLSGGQRQRISIARAFVRNAPILVLDEATAALDSQAEAEVQKALDHLAENRTVISIAHRLSTLQRSDAIIVLSKGRIIERGTFGELLRGEGTFAVMAAKQGIFPS